MPSDSSTYMPSPSPTPESRGKASQPSTLKKKVDKGKGGGNAPWTPQHSNIVRLGLLRAAYASRTSIYTLPGLIGQVDGHGNDRIIKQIQKELKAIAAAWDLDVTMADIKAPLHCGGGSSGAGACPKRKAGTAASRVGTPSKKAKAKIEVDVDSDVE